MYPKKVAQDTAKVLQSYLTYQAVRTILEQLSETNPALAIWLSEYSSGNKMQDGEVYLEGLMLLNKELLLRILTVREHLAKEILDSLPAMVLNGIQESNLTNRRRLLERLTQSQETSENSSPDSDINDSAN